MTISLSLPLLSNKTKVNGMILHHGKSFVKGKDVIIIATGFSNPSDNSKTGKMIQIYILPEKDGILKMYKAGEDKITCNDCKHRSIHSGGMGSCYVDVSKGANQVNKAYDRGNYIEATPELIKEHFKDKLVRFGAYGEPVLLPLATVKAITDVCAGFTGYTHQWGKKRYQAYRSYFMASVDTLKEYRLAKSMGWRTFRVKSKGEKLQKYEFSCPASAEQGKRLTCAECLACHGGNSKGTVAINAHGQKFKIDRFKVARYNKTKG